MCEMKALGAINGFSCLGIFYGNKVNGGLLVGHPWGTYAHTPFLSLYAHTFSPFFFIKKFTFKNSGFSVTSIFKLIFQKLQFPNSIFFLRIPFSNKFPKFNF